jgi:hypothetical protein
MHVLGAIESQVVDHMLSCLFPEPLNPLVEIILQIINLEISSSSKSFDKYEVIFLPKHSTIKHCRNKLYERQNIVHHCYFLFEGVFLTEESGIPEKCFERNEILDEDSLIFKPRVVVIIDSSRLDSRFETHKFEEASPLVLFEPPTSINTKQLGGYDSKFHSHLPKNFSIFDLYGELEKIGCLAYYKTLKYSGFDQ